MTSHSFTRQPGTPFPLQKEYRTHDEGRRLVIRCLETRVQYLFGIPGGESLDYSENDRLLRQEIKERSAAI
ncbi:hypothetical protein [Pseudomonas oryzihabitans]|uniref:hypothetical protein n=1 Tax=Pseudomonas oryzihabitans TaxID=47885 RepID=UPI00119F5C13|nr:hypothetical protein [Pseudomonas oryzihabitans]